MNITLIGMPGSGKSFIGRKLAERSGFSLVDVDKVIEKEAGLSLQQLVEKMGSEEFLDCEAEAAIKSTENRDNLVISPGGSIIYRARAMAHLKNISKIFYLKVPLETLEARIGSVPRGIVIAENKTLADLHDERVPLYEKYADYILKGDTGPESIIKHILSKVSEKGIAE